MNLKIQNTNDGILQKSDELLREHQLIIDAWYTTWSKDQRARVVALYRRKEADSNLRQP